MSSIPIKCHLKVLDHSRLFLVSGSVFLTFVLKAGTKASLAPHSVLAITLPEMCAVFSIPYQFHFFFYIFLSPHQIADGGYVCVVYMCAHVKVEGTCLCM